MLWIASMVISIVCNNCPAAPKPRHPALQNVLHSRAHSFELSLLCSAGNHWAKSKNGQNLGYDEVLTFCVGWLPGTRVSIFWHGGRFFPPIQSEQTEDKGPLFTCALLQWLPTEHSRDLFVLISTMQNGAARSVRTKYGTQKRCTHE